MSTHPITVTIAGDDAQLNAILAKALANVRNFGTQAEASGQKMKESFGEARGAAALLSEEVGVKLNRHLRSVLASSQLIGPILEAAFPIAAAIGFIEVAERIPELIDKATNALAGYTEASQKQYADDLRANEAAISHFKTIAEGYAMLQQFRQESALAARNQDATFNPFQGVGEAFGAGGVTQAIQQLAANMVVFRTSVNDSVKANSEMQKIMERITQLQEERNKKEEEYAKKVEETAKRLANLNFLAYQQSKKAEPSISGIKDNRFASPDDLLNATPDQGVAEKYLARFKALQSVYLATRQPAEALAIEIARLNQLFGDNRGEIYQRAIEQLKDKFDVTRQAVQRFGTEVGRALEQGILMGRSWKNVLESLIVSIAQLIVKLYVLKALQASSFGSTGAGGFVTALLSGFAGGFASGGSMGPGQWGVVGENGPELAFAGSSGMNIVPNRALGGGTVVYNIDARGAGAGAERDIVLALKHTEDRAVARAVAISRENGLRGRN